MRQIVTFHKESYTDTYIAKNKGLSHMKKIKNLIKKQSLSIRLLIATISLITSSITFTSLDKDNTSSLIHCGYSFMHEAVLKNNLDRIKALAKECPSEVNRPSGLSARHNRAHKDTPAHLAAYYGKWEALSLLVALGADLKLSNFSGKTPFKSIPEKHHENFFRALKNGLALKKELSDEATYQKQNVTDNVQAKTKEPQCTSDSKKNSAPNSYITALLSAKVIPLYPSRPTDRLINQISSSDSESIESVEALKPCSKQQSVPPSYSETSANKLNIQAAPFYPPQSTDSAMSQASSSDSKSIKNLGELRSDSKQQSVLPSYSETFANKFNIRAVPFYPPQPTDSTMNPTSSSNSESIERFEILNSAFNNQLAPPLYSETFRQQSAPPSYPETLIRELSPEARIFKSPMTAYSIMHRRSNSGLKDKEDFDALNIEIQRFIDSK